ncbi:MAG: GtrA family protein [Spirosomaceae bacterium]|nr:GtrA family protein [Spirosomataceae bacterium]MDP5141040.1 GtrA family protein [Spirosomataceae bacterium]
MNSDNLTSLFTKLLKFGVVGFSGVLVDFGITYVFKEKLQVNKYVANGLGFSVAVVSNFILNKWWTFENIEPNYAPQFLTFVAVAIGGLAINQLILYLLHEKVKLNFYFAKLLAIGVVTLWNFGFSNYVVFSA